MAKKSKKFSKYNSDRVINSRADSRTYAARALINPNNMLNNGGINDAADMEFRDYAYEGTSYIEAMGKLMGDLVQNYAFNMCVKFVETYVDFFASLADMSDSDIAKMLQPHDELSSEDIPRLKEQFKERWGEVPIPVEYSIKILMKIMDDFRDDPNLIQWQDPELIVMGNPHLLEHMGIKAETVGDYAEDGLKDLAKFVMDFGTKVNEEE